MKRILFSPQQPRVGAVQVSSHPQISWMALATHSVNFSKDPQNPTALFSDLDTTAQSPRESWGKEGKECLKIRYLPTGEIQESPKATPEKLHLMVPS